MTQDIAMTMQEFEHTTSRKAPPSGISPMLEALWFVRKGDWARAHAIVQRHESEPTSALVHAHLHRIEGDLSNAGYWYRRAGSQTAQTTLEAEWKALTARFLEEKK